MTQTKIVVVGNSYNDIIYSRLLEVGEGNPELLIIYVNEDNIDSIDGLDYDLLITDELEDLGMVQFDDCTGLEYRDYTSKIEVKHKKPFYHKGRW